MSLKPIKKGRVRPCVGRGPNSEQVALASRWMIVSELAWLWVDWFAGHRCRKTKVANSIKIQITQCAKHRPRLQRTKSNAMNEKNRRRAKFCNEKKF